MQEAPAVFHVSIEHLVTAKRFKCLNEDERMGCYCTKAS